MENSAPALELIIEDPKPRPEIFTKEINPPNSKEKEKKKEAAKGCHGSEIDMELMKIFKSNFMHSSLCAIGCMITGFIFVYLHENDDPNKDIDMIIARFFTCLAWYALIFVAAVFPNKILFDLVRCGQGEKVRRWCRYKTVAFYLNLFLNSRCQFAELLQRIELEEKRCKV